MFNILQRYVLKDVLLTFFLALTVFTAVVLLGIVFEFVRNELALTQMLHLIPYGLPFTLPFTLPVATLLATSLTFGRLSVDNEITAIRTSGVRIYVILSPMLLFGMLTSLSSLYLQNEVIPPLHYKLRDVRMLAAEILVNQKEGSNFRRSFGNYQIFASHVLGSEYKGLVVFHKPKKGPMVRFVARRGEIAIGKDGNSIEVTTYGARITTFGGSLGGEEAGEVTQGSFRPILPKHTFTIPIRSRSSRQGDKTTSFLLTEADFHMDMAKQKAEKALLAILEEEMAIRDLEKEGATVTEPARRQAIDATLEKRRQRIKSLRWPEEYSMEIYRGNVAEATGRKSLALGCLLSALLGSTLPILMRPKSSLVPFFAGVLVILLIYFPLHHLGGSLSERGYVSPWIGPWLPDILCGGLAGYLLWKVVRR